MLFKKKLDQAFKIAHDGLNTIKKPYISVSWGKDSTFLLWLIHQVDDNIPVVYFNSGYSLPDIYMFRDRILKEWKIKNYFEINIETDYIDLCRQIGLPHERKKSAQEKAVSKIKKDFANNFAKENNFDGHFWGLRAQESKKRLHLLRKNTTFKSNNLVRCAPLAWIKNDELWYMFKYYKIPYCEIYNKTKFIKKDQIRNSGWLSTDNAHCGQEVWLKYYYRDYYYKLIKEFPRMRSYV